MMMANLTEGGNLPDRKRKPNKGDTIWEWTVIEPVRIQGKTRTYAGYRCECSCSTPDAPIVRDILAHHLWSGNTKSCGHYRASRDWQPKKPKSVEVKSRIRVLPGNLESHADYETIRRTWYSIKDRCHNPNSTACGNYGGRGIKMYVPWRDDSRAFIRWVIENLGRRPEGRSIDRIDVNGDYEPGNLRWATQAEQMQNTRSQLDPMNGVIPTPKSSTWGYAITRDGEKLAEYGFETPEDAADGRDSMLAVYSAGGPEAAMQHIQNVNARKEARRMAEVEDKKREAEEKQALAVQARKDAAAARKAAVLAENQARRDAKAAAKSERAARYHELNKTMTLAEIARRGDLGTSVAHVSIELKKAGIPVVRHSSTGYPGVKKRVRDGRVTYIGRAVIDGKRQEWERKTPGLAYEAAQAAKAGQPIPHHTHDDSDSATRDVAETDATSSDQARQRQIPDGGTTWRCRKRAVAP